MMNRIVWHHTGGGYSPGPEDRRAYHRLIDGDGQVHDGHHAIAANAPGRALTPGTYAAHTRGLNTGAIGVAICAMAGAGWGGAVPWTHPVKPVQVDALVAETARLCDRYGIVPGPRITLSHAEVEPTLGVVQAGKWDFDYPPRGGPGARDPIAIGDELRAEVARLLSSRPVAPDPIRPVLRQGATGQHVRDLQRLLRGPGIDGAFGPLTRRAVVEFQSRNELLPDGIVGPMTWAALAPQG
ncbi:Peptidoglycan-binding (PGRP) domain of peptidoglycan hydrolases-containing protein [Gemmobacter megaterium]|uniref:Peptidoglycan-binding (PGRP) domain of peptidoglycan hydrolases-containing protein n=1 Tax=Gemmobacter megaterium TaxID=1086013 RepID=A0A1N7QJW8_9RHOB|nr:peptidoglycan-binding domain-containing protein [Gemmobacter megaterium]GGE26519.1 hypothetical protein GCM10011345_35600 [Gemmobacter megaterium]SIT22797.1 Peptidoglycan-binding (PGRP) domain of peptidoglycan hydrolases-containing protein [Gemmobacter megaterium]